MTQRMDQYLYFTELDDDALIAEIANTETEAHRLRRASSVNAQRLTDARRALVDRTKKAFPHFVEGFVGRTTDGLEFKVFDVRMAYNKMAVIATCFDRTRDGKWSQRTRLNVMIKNYMPDDPDELEEEVEDDLRENYSPNEDHISSEDN